MEERFWSKVRKFAGEDACWVWVGALNNKGYGIFHLRPGVTITAHKHSFQSHHPRIELGTVKRQCVMHKCDNRRCVRPDHLIAGTLKQNSRDMVRRGRAIKKGGVAHGNSKLSWAIVRNMRQNYKGRYGELKSLCALYGVSKAAVQDVLTCRSWKEPEAGNAKTRSLP